MKVQVNCSIDAVVYSRFFAAWERLRREGRLNFESKSEYVEYCLNQFAEQAEALPDLKTCEKCGAKYAPHLSECPNCK